MNRIVSIAAISVVASAAVVGCASSAFTPSGGERPGLGTRWGEGRVSRVHEVAFERAGVAPQTQAVVRYDDNEGVLAMAGASDPVWREARVNLCPGLELELIDDRGRPLPMLTNGEHGFVTGRPGQRYALLVHNRTPRRYEVVTSVDGLDVLDGRSASLSKRGYIVEPGGELSIEGFRKSTWEVASFRFGAVADSYAARQGNDRAVGVIGVAVFNEQGDDRTSEAERRLRAEPFAPTRFAQAPRHAGVDGQWVIDGEANDLFE